MDSEERFVVRQIVNRALDKGFLQTVFDGEEFPVLQLTADGVALLKNPAALDGLELARQKKPVKGRARERSRVEAECWDGVDRALFDELRALRLDIARDRGVPPYVIFHDTTLRELARLKPSTRGELEHVYGIGARKAEDLGDAVLQVIRTHAFHLQK